MTERRGLLALSGVLAALAIGLPWSSFATVATVMGGVTPVPAPCAGDFCFDIVQISFWVAGEDATYLIPGTQHTVRVIAVISATLIWWGVRHAKPKLARNGWWLGLIGLALEVSNGIYAGHLVYAGALALAAIALGLFRPIPAEDTPAPNR